MEQGLRNIRKTRDYCLEQIYPALLGSQMGVGKMLAERYREAFCKRIKDGIVINQEMKIEGDGWVFC